MKVSERLMVMAVAGVAMMGTGTAAADPQRGVRPDKVVLGSHTDLSGPLAIWGAPATNGARLRIEEANAAGGVHGRKIEFLVEDTAYQVPQAVRATNKLVSRDGIFAMLLGAGTSQSLASMEITDKAGIPSLFPLTGARSMAEPLHPLHFTYFVSYYDQAAGGLKYFRKTQDVQTVCLQTHASDYGEEITRGVTDAAKELGMKLLMVGTHKPTETDFAGAATAIKNAGCDLAYLGTTTKDTIALHTTLRKLGFKGTTVGNMVSYVPIVAQAGGMDGYYAVTPAMILDPKDGEPVKKRFFDAYRAKHNEAPSLQSQVGYVSADLVVRALEAAGRDLTVQRLTAALEAVRNYRDHFGGTTISFGPDKHFGGDSLLLMQVKGADWAMIQDNLPY